MPRLKIVLTAFCILLASATFALAATDGEHSLPWGNFAFRILNLLLFIGVIAYFFGKKIVSFFKERTQGIVAEIAGLEERKVLAQKNLAEIEAHISRLDEERQEILTQYAAQGEALKASIISQAQKTAEQIAAQAKTTAQNEVNAAVEAMRAEMAEEIVKATERLLAQKLSESEHLRLVDKYLTKVVLN